MHKVDIAKCVELGSHGAVDGLGGIYVALGAYHDQLMRLKDVRLSILC